MPLKFKYLPRYYNLNFFILHIVDFKIVTVILNKIFEFSLRTSTTKYYVFVGLFIIAFCQSKGYILLFHILQILQSFPK